MKNKTYLDMIYVLSLFIGVFLTMFLLNYIGIIGIFIFLGFMALTDYLMFEYVFKIKKTVGG